MPKVIFVCTGNTCRSPMAEHLFRRIIDEDSDLKGKWEISSAGIAALPGQGPSKYAIKVLKDEGIDINEHLSRQLDEKLVKEADLILTMTGAHKEMVLQIDPEARDKVFTLKEFAGIKNDLDIADPFGQSEEVYQEVRDEIKAHLKEVIGKRKQFFLEEGKKRKIKNTYYRRDGNLKIAIGCDHAGYAIKKEITDLLEEEGFAYTDFGTDSSESVDYPDFAYKVASGVASGQFDRGILICGTGIGMSIAANKVKGIRAALCHDVFSARATRNHNNSNVLTMGSRVIGAGLAREIVRVWLGAEFDGGRHQRRIDKIELIERGEYRENE
ncbi:MAG: ribose 5-phosphate isomerase [Halanaerobiales bacterium]|nr:ribose 5-phosphate isomerase [Halanaerobiales bacterium]